MAISVIDVGTTANDGTGDTLRAAFVKVNANEADLDTRVSAAIPATEKGAASGVAALDADGRLTTLNRPFTSSAPGSSLQPWRSVLASAQETMQPVLGRMHFSPIEAPGPIAAIRVEVVTAGSAGSVVRLGIYANDPTKNLPAELLADAGTIDATVAGFYQVDLSPTVQRQRDEWVWVAIVSQGEPTTLPVLRSASRQGLQHGPLRDFYVAPAFSVFWSVVTGLGTAATTFTGVLPNPSPLLNATPGPGDFYAGSSARTMMASIQGALG